jgi:hypothetical protein
MLMATVPSNYARLLGISVPPNEVAPDGQAIYVPNGLRVVESLLLQRFSPENIAVCYTDQLGFLLGRTPAWLAFTRTILSALLSPRIYMRISGEQRSAP